MGKNRNKKRISLKMYDVKPVNLAEFSNILPENEPEVHYEYENYYNEPYAEPNDPPEINASNFQGREYRPDFLYDNRTDKNASWNFSSKLFDFNFKFKKNLSVWRSYLWKALKLSAAVFVLYVAANAVITGINMKNGGIVKSQAALADLMSAKDSLTGLDFSKSKIEFEDANEKLTEISSQLDGANGILVELAKFLPYVSKISSGGHLISAGKNISEAGIVFSQLLESVEKMKKVENESVSYLKIFQDNEDNLKKIAVLLEEANGNLNEVNADDVPDAYKDKIIEIKKILPEANTAIAGFLSQESLIKDILGGNGPRKYLFLFQNNQEMRATGGFIGTYAILDIFNGRVRNFFVDGIFNPDGQLRTRIVPPTPVQKISANWSLHDSNWFPDFPKSAEKAAWFYEKTGGPTVDGVITMTPTVIQSLLEVTGPIPMPEYDVVVDKDNFIEKIQYEVEVDYDKELNQPKKILGDLASKILDKIFNSPNFEDLAKAMNILHKNLNEKQILIYSKNWQIEKTLSANGWTGEILATPKDYLSVINTNINGYKTDGVVREKISIKAEIQPDGSIIDTVTIERKHNGGDTPYEWWNKVNADYMRVYVPKGSKLISASGHTREFNAPPLDYKALGYKQDAQLQMEEDTAQIDEESGTKIYEDAGKTVFANWVYVSPKETVTVKYVYVLPFKIDSDDIKKSVGTYSILIQKQSGSLGSELVGEVDYPDFLKPLWKFPEDTLAPENLPENTKGIRMEADLKTDKFIGAAFSK